MPEYVDAFKFVLPTGQCSRGAAKRILCAQQSNFERWINPKHFHRLNQAAEIVAIELGKGLILHRLANSWREHYRRVFH